MSKHTKGPWEIIGHPDDDECRIRQTESVKHGKGFYSEITICEQINRMGNAHLIAAAPDLLEAIVKLLEFWQPSGSSEEHDIQAIAYAAIAKAKGESA